MRTNCDFPHQCSHMHIYIHVCVCVFLSVLEFASIGLTLVRFTQTNGKGVPENCVNNVD